jgi:hypothetical protein
MGIANVNIIGAYDFIIDTLRDGYKIPFYSVPLSVCLSNNLSAMKHTDIVDSAIVIQEICKIYVLHLLTRKTPNIHYGDKKCQHDDMLSEYRT